MFNKVLINKHGIYFLEKLQSLENDKKKENEINIFKIELKNGKTGFEELWHKEKGIISHRGKATEQLINFLKTK